MTEPTAEPTDEPDAPEPDPPEPTSTDSTDSTEATAGSGSTGAPSVELVALARAHGVATEYWDWQGRQVMVSADTVASVLSALDVDVSSPRAVAASREDAELRAWRRMLPPTVVCREGTTPWVAVHLPHGELVQVWAELEDGTKRSLTQQDHWVDPRVVDGRQVGEATFEVPADLPLGWHSLRARCDSHESVAALIVTPARIGLPAALTSGERSWGFMTQLYAIRSHQSWGLGDLGDLTQLAVWSGADLGADFVLVNPLHAAEPAGRMEPSPYLPTTRRFVNPVYLRVEDVPEVAYMPAAERQLLEWQAESVQTANTSSTLDRDASWTAKRSALEAVYRVPRTLARERAFERFRVEQGEGLTDFATWCAIAEVHGPRWSLWPVDLHDPRSPAVQAERERLSERVSFYCWLQWVLDEQLEAVQRRARGVGMRLGVVHDMAVGVHAEGADAWSLGRALARDVTVGAPPDAFNQQGQDWSQPPWRPDRLAELGYQPYRDMLRTVLRHAGGLRVDHVAGLFRLWWVPAGRGPDEGTYVRYDHEAMVGILALEAHRAGALVVGEDLGVVEPWVRDYLQDRGVFGTSILWFEKDDDGQPLEPESWRELCLATVATHDLPPTAGYLAGEHVALRERLGLLTRTPQEERAVDEADRARVLDLLRARGLLHQETERDGTEREAVEALHRFLTWTPARLIGVSVADAVGDRRAVNQPGTRDEYPNWRLPLADGQGHPVLLEELFRSRRARSLARAVALG